MAGRNRSFCSSVPNSNMVGASRKTPFWLTRRGAWARQYSSSKTSHSRMPTPRPPNSSGHDTTDHRSSNMVCSHCPVGLEPLGGVERGERPGRRGVGGQPRAGLGPEGLLGRR